MAMKKVQLLSLAATFAAALVMSPTAEARPTVVGCGAGTHAVVRHSVVDGRRVRQVSCVRNASTRRNVIGTTRRTVAACGPGTHRVIHHPVVNGHRIRRVTCVAG
jgi:hypothetical protein